MVKKILYAVKQRLDPFFICLPDQKDDHILELAVGSGVKTILTHNIKDFAEISKFGIRVITPKTLLEEIK